MQHSELLHRFFDEGLQEPLEDVLFGQMALDPELRREFVSHLKLHSIIQEDVAGITTPSHVSARLFASLGLGVPETPAPEPVRGLRDSAGEVWQRLRGLVTTHRRELSVGMFSAFVTALLLLQFTTRDVPILGTDRSTRELSHARETVATPPSERGTAISESRPMARAEARNDRSSAGMTAATAPKSTGATFAAVTAPAVVTNAPAAVTNAPASVHAAHPMQPPGGAAVPADLPEAAPMDAVVSVLGGVGEGGVDAARLGIADVVIAELPEIDPPWRFTQPGPRENIFSNLIVELRRVYGRSYPEVDQQHNSFNVFENMAISVVSKTTEHHAFGLEYGRENFGREFQRLAEPQTPLLSFADPSSAEVYRPPVQTVTGPQRENRMLDVVGAVWKLSLPEYGLFDIVYPYLRTLVGATKLGPVGKVRAGLEMYPSNYSMLNVGLEGGMLRYMVDDIPYYTAKLNFTFGVAIGF